ncbi:hypothetical protein E3N88_33110 [Mikania micrantha]|uniref:Uncharacterized protein n=1 Tax=Mikania micrantha TaxID=192012 RepID=A0A5N6MAH8_9ASTR|nr:hypothetical protein E3N88_33110 [Mikania micrantha]
MKRMDGNPRYLQSCWVGVVLETEMRDTGMGWCPGVRLLWCPLRRSPLSHSRLMKKRTMALRGNQPIVHWVGLGGWNCHHSFLVASGSVSALNNNCSSCLPLRPSPPQAPPRGRVTSSLILGFRSPPSPPRGRVPSVVDGDAGSNESSMVELQWWRDGYDCTPMVNKKNAATITTGTGHHNHNNQTPPLSLGQPPAISLFVSRLFCRFQLKQRWWQPLDNTETIQWKQSTKLSVDQVGQAPVTSFGNLKGLPHLDLSKPTGKPRLRGTRGATFENQHLVYFENAHERS